MDMQQSVPFHMMAKPGGAVCNLDCSYCYYLTKDMLYPGDRLRMAYEVMDAYIRQLIEAHAGQPITVAWQGGEPTLMGLDFFRRAVERVRYHAPPGTEIQHTVQTNGTLLGDAWCAFLREQGFLVGLSLDGPPDLHDTHRRDKRGRGTAERVIRAVQRLQRHGVEFNILCSVHASNVDHPLRVYRFLRDELGVRFMQFIPIVERLEPGQDAPHGWGRKVPGRTFYTQAGSEVSARTVDPVRWGAFLNTIFDEWLRHDVRRVFVQSFENALEAWVGMDPSLCVFRRTCGRALALEHNGDVYSCDHYVEPGHRLGNITDTHMAELVESPRQQAFGRAKSETLPRQCRACRYRFACNGGCPRNRFVRTTDDEDGLNYLCTGYRAFFRHIDPAMRRLAHMLRASGTGHGVTGQAGSA